MVVYVAKKNVDRKLIVYTHFDWRNYYVYTTSKFHRLTVWQQENLSPESSSPELIGVTVLHEYPHVSNKLCRPGLMFIPAVNTPPTHPPPR